MKKPFALIVEDNPKLSSIYNTVLQTGGYDTEVIANGDEALAWVKTVVPDLILLDIHLPYVSGEEVLRYIRSDSRVAHIPVILLTADLYAAKALEDQVEHVIIKSLGVSKLRVILEELRMKYEAGT